MDAQKLQEMTRCEPLRMCNCIGPQRGAPVCPCAMRNVLIEGGRYIQRIDLGPAPLEAQALQSVLLGTTHFIANPKAAE